MNDMPRGEIGGVSVIKLAKGVRLREDAVRKQTVLLAPERAIALDEIAVAIVNALDGQRSLAETITRHGEGWRGRGGMVVISANRTSEWVEALVDTATRGQRHLCIFIEPTSFGAKGQALRIPAAWRLRRQAVL